jgi:hypothetical protein
MVDGLIVPESFVVVREARGIATVDEVGVPAFLARRGLAESVESSFDPETISEPEAVARGSLKRKLTAIQSSGLMYCW